MKQDKFTIGIIVLTAAVVVAGAAFAAKTILANAEGDGTNQPHEQMKQAVKDKDFGAWKGLISERANKMLDGATEENFNKATEAHQLMQDGKHEEAKQLLRDAGLPMMGHGKDGTRDGMDPEARDAIKEALDNSDYEAFKELKADKPMSNKITEKNFDKLIESHNLREAGGHEGARVIMEELGLGMKGLGPRGNCK